MTEKCHQLFGRDLNTVLHVLLHHAQIGGRVVLHNIVNFFLKRFWEVTELLQWTGQWLGGNTFPTAEERSDYTAVRLEGRIFAYRLWYFSSIDNVSTTLHKLQLGSLPSSLSAELESLLRAIEHCISLVLITEAADVERKLKHFWMQSRPSVMGCVTRQCG
jgi:hypothetical protein